MLASPYEGLSRSNIAQQSSKGSLFTNFEDVEVTAIITVIISLPGEVQSIVMSTSVCLSVCLSIVAQIETTKLHQIFVHVAYDRGSVLL